MRKAATIIWIATLTIVALAMATPLTHSSQPAHHYSVDTAQVDTTAQFFPLEQRYTTWVYTEAGWQHSSVTLY